MPNNPGSRLGHPDQPAQQRPLAGQLERPDPDPRPGAAADEALDPGGPERAAKGDLGMRGRPEPKHSAESPAAPFALDPDRPGQGRATSGPTTPAEFWKRLGGR